ncbi:MAG TPA: hypothetical protein VE866_15540 [Candidatus Binatia bacterium]|jgi:hypothetical protein|nr:hypothetical protein [Candidatus Binatia bacterium]
MLGIKLVRLIEAHSEALSQAVVNVIRTSERTSDFRAIPREDLQRRVCEVYRNLGEWLLQKTEGDISIRFKAIAARRVAEGIRLPQFIWALMLTRDHLLHFLRHEAFADNVVALYGELELHQLLDQFYDRAVYHSIVGYEEASSKARTLSGLNSAGQGVGGTVISAQQ